MIVAYVVKTYTPADVEVAVMEQRMLLLKWISIPIGRWLWSHESIHIMT